MSRMIYTKYSLDRVDRFKIRTDIVVDKNGSKTVEKIALTDSANEHLAKFYSDYEALSEYYKNTKININPCSYDNGKVVFPYIEGQTFENILDDDLKAGNAEEVLRKIKQFSELVKSGAHKGFVSSYEFSEVFGDLTFDKNELFVNVANLNMFFKNMIVNDSGFCMLDYEWTFHCDIPVNYILYRAILQYLTARSDYPERNVLNRIGLQNIIDMNDDEVMIFCEMDKRLCNYITGRTLTWKEIQQLIGKPVINMKERLLEYIHEQDCNRTQIFYDLGPGFREEDSEFISSSNKDSDFFKYEISIPKDCKSLRIDPMTGFGYLELKEILLDDTKAEYETNGVLFDNMLVFQTDDPQIIIPDVLDKKQVKIEWKTHLADSSLVNGIIKKYRELEDKTVTGFEIGENSADSSPELVNDIPDAVKKQDNKEHQKKKSYLNFRRKR